MSKTTISGSVVKMLSVVFLVILFITAVSVFVFYLSMKSETQIRYEGIKEVASEKISKIVWGMEVNAQNVFDEVSKNLGSSEDVIEALQSKANLNPEVRGYFAAFVPNYFPKQGTWFEPYVHQTESIGHFEVSLVGSARHNYTKSDWYTQAMRTHTDFWSDPYYYYDGTSISGHYCTFVKPILDSSGHVVCVCGADMTFEWLAKELLQIDKKMKSNGPRSLYNMLEKQDFYTVILDKDGSCVAFPEGKRLSLTDRHVIADLSQHKGGIIDMDVNGVPSTVYYGPIERVNWSVAVVVPQQSIWKPLAPASLLLFLTSVLGMIIIWYFYRKMVYA